MFLAVHQEVGRLACVGRGRCARPTGGSRLIAVGCRVNKEIHSALVDKIIQMIPSAFEDFREVSFAVVKVRNVRFVPLGRTARDLAQQRRHTTVKSSCCKVGRTANKKTKASRRNRREKRPIYHCYDVWPTRRRRRPTLHNDCVRE
jgi:hypothetical protein